MFPMCGTMRVITTGRGCASPPGLKQPKASLGHDTLWHLQRSQPIQPFTTDIHSEITIQCAVATPENSVVVAPQ